MKPLISAIICAHDPRPDYLTQVLEALRAQTLPPDQWELLLIDNASSPQLEGRFNLGWHPHAQHVREEELGLTPARLCGIREALGDVLVFVDDDNRLDTDFLETTVRIAATHPAVGAWGGQVRPRFEVDPPLWTQPYWELLAIRQFDQDRVSNRLHQFENTPAGAGLCVRAGVAQVYIQNVMRTPLRRNLDRVGEVLTSCGDSDLAFTACDMGLSTGLFAALRLTHLIPASRLEESYLLRLAEGIAYSTVMLESFRGVLPPPPRESAWHGLARWLWLRQLSPRERRFYLAKRRGRVHAAWSVKK